jgi:NADPH-dependent curcumin reductase CurA
MSGPVALGEVRRAVVLRRRPAGEPKPDDFEMIETPIPAPGPGEVVTRTLWLSLDPYMRGRLSDRKSYAPSVEIGGVIEGETVGEVVASQDPRVPLGELVVGARGWQTHAVSKGDTLAIVGRDAPASTYLGVLGMPGVTAYDGMTDIGQPKAGETAVITAASGAVGSVAGQLAKRAGARVVGVAGGPAKCAFVTGELGFDACVDHKAPGFAQALAAACPDGIDVYFENVGGAVQAAAFPLLNFFSRVVMCGMVSQANAAEFPPGPNLGFVVGKRVRIQGLIVFDKPERYAEWRALAGPWVADGSLRYREDVVEGLENAPAALAGLLRGDNFGKLVVKVA